MIIMKFGGTSVKDAPAIENVCSIIENALPRNPVVVVSALAGVTDLLEESALKAANQETQRTRKLISAIEKQHLQVIRDLFKPNSTYYDQAVSILNDELEKLTALLNATTAIRRQSGDLNHVILSAGEILSSHILTYALQQRGLAAQNIDARKIMILHHKEDQITPHLQVIKQNAASLLSPLLMAKKLPVTQGFIGTTTEGFYITLGRNGSDYSASLLGAALGAEEIQIWTDVDGILSADPSIIPYARPLQSMSFDEASELAYFGARVLYPAAIQPAVSQGIPVRVLNSNSPDSPGTLIVSSKKQTDSVQAVQSIAYKENITLITVRSPQLLLSPKLPGQLLTHLSQNGIGVYAVSKSATKLALTVESSANLTAVLNAFPHAEQIETASQKAIVSLVGDAMKRHPNISWQVIKRLREAEIKLHLISQFDAQISFTFIIDEQDIEKAVTLLHQYLIEPYW